MIVLGEAHLRRIPKSYANYYNGVRTHRSLNKDAPVSGPVQRSGVISFTRHPWRTSSPLWSNLRFSVHTGAELGIRRDRALRGLPIETKIDRIIQRSGGIS
jgi:hypothetical protein